jgi:predicted GNAT family N-acyltransferase
VADFKVRSTDWQRDEAGIRAVRTAVFIEEQRVPVEAEWDEHDATAAWAVAEDAEGRAIGCGRLLADRTIGRVAVLSDWRGKGVGDALMRELLLLAYERGDDESTLSSQSHAVPFYERLGYRAEGEEYLDVGIPHRRMRLALRPVRRDAALGGAGSRAAPRRLSTVQQNRDAALELANAAERGIAIYTQDLDPAVYDTPEFVAAARALGLKGRVPRVRVLVVDPQRAVREDHRLIALHQQLTSYVQIRVPDPDDAVTAEAWLIADEDAILYRVQGDQYGALLETAGSSLARLKLREFERLWERATTDPGLRRLHI